MIDLSEFGITSIGNVEVQPDSVSTEELPMEGMTVGAVALIPNKRNRKAAKLSERIERAAAGYKKIRMSEPQPMTCSVCNADNVHILFVEHSITVGCILCNPTYIRKNWSNR